MTAAAAANGGLRLLDRELLRLEAGALIVLSGSVGLGADAAWFVGGAKLGDCLIVYAASHEPRLAYFTPMERDEARATGLALLEPERLDLARCAKENPEPGGFLAAALSAALQQSGLPPGRLALAGVWPAGALIEASRRLAVDGWRLVDGTRALQRARKRKREPELREIARVAGVTVQAFRAVATRLATAVERDGELWSEAERLTVGQLKREIALLFASDGLTEPRANIVAPGEEGGVPHNAGKPDRVLRAGETLIVDLFPKGLLFADCTRTFVVGEPKEIVVRAHADVRAAVERASSAARPGRRGWEIQQEVCALFAERGWPTPISAPGTLTGYVHNLGHGVGLELHELPSFKETANEEDGLLAVGDVVTLEPGLYQPGPDGWGVRLEDLLVVTRSGTENLTPLPYELDPRAWS